MKQKFNFSKLISILKASSVISKVEIKTVDEIGAKRSYQ